MALQSDGTWLVVKGDCLWNIAKSVYGNPYRWTEIADANGVSRSTALIYPGQRLKIPGQSSSGSSTPAPAANYSTSVTVQWWALDSGTTRSMFCTWSYDRANTAGYEITWEYDTGAGGWRVDGGRQTTSEKQASYTAPDNAKKVRITIKPVSTTYQSNNQTVYYWTDGKEVVKEYDFSNNPPSLPPSPSFSINTKNILTVEFTNIDENINADNIEIAIYQDDTYKWKTATVAINKDARYAKYTCTVDNGHKYKVRARAVRGSIYGGWTDFTDNDSTIPIAPKEITTLRSQVVSEQMSKSYGVYVEWTPVDSVDKYIVQWTTSLELFDTGQESSQETEEGSGSRLLVMNIELGHLYYFRVGSVNDKGRSTDWTPIKSVILGTRPSAPTTWSNTSSAIIGEDLNLYWVHNSTDGSLETYARINFEVTDSAHPDIPPMIITKVIENTKPDDERDRTSIYTINTEDPDWATVGQGYIIKWKVQTCGVTAEYSEWSIEREVNVYAKPEVTLDILNNQSVSVDEVNAFPFYFAVQASPVTQTPISYYIEVISNNSYTTVDSIGKVKMVDIGDKIFQKYYDPQINPWRFLLELTPGNIDLENNCSYTINIMVAMNSGLTAITSKTFIAYFNDMYYDVFADLIYNPETLNCSIHPYCYQYDEDRNPSLVENCTLAVYRIQYDGSYMLIEENIPNEENLYITDPHPALDYARYRVVARTNDTGSISYADVNPIKIGNPAIVIQWAEEWSSFISDEQGNGAVEPSWEGSMLILPYNIKVSEDRGVEVNLVDYVGRDYPVSYYGTHISESTTWNTEIPKEDKETLYAIRRLSKWKGDVYVREPSGMGYWAAMAVSFNIDYSAVIVPVTFTIRRVEGGV